ncbi:MAG: helix-turn-helix domain-containing protein [bacterium]|nr:helix-turn-helix domain-containing protein [bacterium]
MPKGIPNKRYISEFKQMVVEVMRKEGLSYKETVREFDVCDDHRVASLERIYFEVGPEGLYAERRGRKNTGRLPKHLKPKIKEDLVAEVQRLRAGNAYLKELKALVIEEERQDKRRK